MFPKIKAYIRGAFKSKTIWFSSILGALGAISDSSQYVRSLMSDVNFNQFMIAIAIITAILRMTTTKPLDEK